MPATELPAPSWPLPKIEASRLEESRRIIASEPDGSLQHTLSWIRVLAAARDVEGARQKFASSEILANTKTLSHSELRQVIPLLLLIHEERSAVRMLDAVSPTPTMHVRFTVAHSPAASAVSMRVEGRVAAFIIGDSTFDREDAEVLLQRLVDIYPMLANYFQYSGRLDGTVFINLDDGPGQKFESGATGCPGLSFCDYRPGYFLVPDPTFMDLRGYRDLRDHFSRNLIPWDDRVAKAFWRGATTGLPREPSLGWRSLPRIRLCEIGLRNSDTVDAGITNVVQIDDATALAWLTGAGLMRPHVAPESFQQFKYQIDIDGNTTSWPGLFMKLLTRSVVLKVPPRDGLEQWYYDRLKPWVNFIPLLPDLSDLPAKVSWLREHDQTAQAIGEAGYRLADELSYEREVERSSPIVAAAIKDASDTPPFDLDFNELGAETQFLREGWSHTGHGAAATTGSQSRIDIPRTPGIGGIVVGIDVSPALAYSQRLSVAVAGDILVQQRIDARTTIYIPVSYRQLAGKDLIELTLLHPDAALAASAEAPGDTRISGLLLHRIWGLRRCTPGAPATPELTEAFCELRSLDDPDSAHQLNGPAPEISKDTSLSQLYSVHGTMVYADLAANRLRHGKTGSVPENLFIAWEGDRAILVRRAENGLLRTVCLMPEGPVAHMAEREALNAYGRVESFRLISDQASGGSAMSLSGAGLLLCAEDSGGILLGRTAIGPWEIFRPHQQANRRDSTKQAPV